MWYKPVPCWTSWYQQRREVWRHPRCWYVTQWSLSLCHRVISRDLIIHCIVSLFIVPFLIWVSSPFAKSIVSKLILCNLRVVKEQMSRRNIKQMSLHNIWGEYILSKIGEKKCRIKMLTCDIRYSISTILMVLFILLPITFIYIRTPPVPTNTHISNHVLSGNYAPIPQKYQLRSTNNII